MKQKLLSMVLLVMVTLSTFNCESDSTGDSKLTIDQRVTNAKVLYGTLSNRTGFITIDIPSTGGYLEFEVKSAAETREIARLVYERFKKEFDEAIVDIANGRVLDEWACGEWVPISPTDPNSKVTRNCCSLTTGVCVRQTCECGYCACPEEIGD